MPALAPHTAACEAGSGGGQAVLMNPLPLSPLPQAEPQPALGGSVRASRAASARPACGRMRGRLRRRAGRAMNPLSLPPLPPAEPKPAAGGSVRASRAASARPACEARCGGEQAGLMNPLFLPRLPPAEPQPAPGCSVRASRAASARPARGRMRGRLRRRAGRAYEPPLPATAAAGRAEAGAWRQREGFTGCQRSPRMRPHARQAAEEGKQCL